MVEEEEEQEEDMASHSLKGHVYAGLIDTLTPTLPHSTRLPLHTTSAGHDAATTRYQPQQQEKKEEKLLHFVPVLRPFSPCRPPSSVHPSLLPLPEQQQQHQETLQRSNNNSSSNNSSYNSSRDNKE